MSGSWPLGRACNSMSSDNSPTPKYPLYNQRFTPKSRARIISLESAILLAVVFEPCNPPLYISALHPATRKVNSLLSVTYILSYSRTKYLQADPPSRALKTRNLLQTPGGEGGRVIRRISCLWGIDSGIPLRRNLLQQPLPRLLILPKSLLHILQNPLKVRIRFQIVPSRILLEPWIILIP